MQLKSPSLTALFAALTAVGSFIVIPVGPVPVTLQTLFTILAGSILGAKGGALSQVIYIIIGFAGLPVFSRGGSGPGFLLGPTGGYLIGFVAGAALSGFFSSRGKVLTGFIAASAVIYIPGLLWLKLYTRMAWGAALLAGFIPFIPGDIIKIIAALGIYRKLEKSGVMERFAK
ncbi:MAG: biotin transporter BioY [Elusimicrobiota bacterium]